MCMYMYIYRICGKKKTEESLNTKLNIVLCLHLVCNSKRARLKATSKQYCKLAEKETLGGI